jgi:exodeoxyribonuclease VII small subunit
MVRNPTPASPNGAEGSPSFEEAIERLQTIVEELEGGGLSLEESIARYEEGMRLSKRLTQTLEEAEKRIEQLVEGEGPKPATKAIELDLKAGEGDVEGKLPF